MNILADICSAKRQHVEQQKNLVPLARLEAQIRSVPAPRDFASALDKARYGLIAEMKRASPSGGAIRPNFDPAAIARAYEQAGAACLSVLTDTPFFKGQDEDLGLARNACSLPVLRKDFILDPYQIAESRALGADCILLILSCLNDTRFLELAAATEHYGMSLLIEVHDERELERALAWPRGLIGINNRNLDTLVTDLAVCERLAPLVPENRKIVGESGIRTHADLLRLEKSGITRFLVGEHLLRQENLVEATRTLLSDP